MRGLANSKRSTAPSNGMDAKSSAGVPLSSPAAAQRCAEGAGLDSGAPAAAQSAMPSIAPLPPADRRPPITFHQRRCTRGASASVSNLHQLDGRDPEIQNYVFRTQSPRQLFELFTGYEAAWRQRMQEERSLITPEPEDEILISFADGYAWWLLPRGGCPVEAEAMGHCGNVPSQRPGDQILSLRRQVRRGDVIRWYPVATFILDDDGKLGEMKGRGNDKPAAKYHPYVVELLRHHLIRGIKGGGYMPENNFSMSDLDPQTREQLIAAKPELKGLLGYYEDEGMTERVLDMLGTKLRERDLPDYESYDAEKRNFVLSTYRDLEQFVSTNGDEILEQLLELRERAFDSHTDMSVKADLNEKMLRRFLEMLPNRAFADIAISCGIDPATSNAKRLTARQLEFYGGPMFNGIEQAFAAASGHEALIKALGDRIAEYVEGWSFDCSHVWALPVNPSNLPDSAIEIRIAEWDLLYIATAEAESDDEHAYDAQKVAYNRSWDDLDLESTFEHRRENGLIRRKSGRGSWEYEDTQFSNPESINFDTDDLIDAAVEVYLDPRKSSPTVRDPRQFELTLEALRRRAGIAGWSTGYDTAPCIAHIAVL